MPITGPCVYACALFAVTFKHEDLHLFGFTVYEFYHTP